MASSTSVHVVLPDDLAPIVTVLDAESTPVRYNDPKLAVRVKAASVGALGAQNDLDDEPIMGSEDFGVFGLEKHEIRTVMFWLGAMDPTRLASATAAGKSLPGRTPATSSRYLNLPSGRA